MKLYHRLRLPAFALALVAFAATGCETEPTVDAEAEAEVPVATAAENTSLPVVPAGTYEIDPAHARAEFQVRHMGLARVSGHFQDVEGQIVVPEGDPQNMQFTAAIDASSIDTENTDRDDHLRSPDFFDVEQYPTIEFESTGVRPGESEDEFIIEGNLTMHGETHPIEMEATFMGATTGMQGAQLVGFEAETEIDRREWGLDWSKTNEAGELVVGDMVQLEISAEAIKQ